MCTIKCTNAVREVVFVLRILGDSRGKRGLRGRELDDMSMEDNDAFKYVVEMSKTINQAPNYKSKEEDEKIVVTGL
jgi:hypothetical protein